jgi:hypothetical protein
VTGRWHLSWALGGVEAMRFSGSRLGVALNLDLPTTSLDTDNLWDSLTGNELPRREKYIPFFGLSAYLMFGR